MMSDIWIGSRYGASDQRVLVLGESTYGSDPPLAEYIPMWIQRAVRDTTFARIFNAFSGTHTSRASITEREAFWAGIAFYNFVTCSVGPTRNCRPTIHDYRGGQAILETVLEQYHPTAVLILGREQAYFSEPVVARFGIRSVTTEHPASYGLRSQVLSTAWQDLKSHVGA
jgi:hypothetical protein